MQPTGDTVMIKILSGTYYTPSGLLLSGFHLYRQGKWVGTYKSFRRAQTEAVSLRGVRA
jgi:hypothetical protein